MMVLNDDQAMIPVSDRATVFITESHGDTLDRVNMTIRVIGGSANVHMTPKQAREIAAALIAFSGEAT
jgi:hypothetical protein